LGNWGYKDFAKTWRKESIEESSADQPVAGRAIERSLGFRPKFNQPYRRSETVRAPAKFIQINPS
jgi:hypothetical protein